MKITETLYKFFAITAAAIAATQKNTEQPLQVSCITVNSPENPRDTFGAYTLKTFLQTRYLQTQGNDPFYFNLFAKMAIEEDVKVLESSSTHDVLVSIKRAKTHENAADMYDHIYSAYESHVTLHTVAKDLPAKEIHFSDEPQDICTKGEILFETKDAAEVKKEILKSRSEVHKTYALPEKLFSWTSFWSKNENPAKQQSPTPSPSPSFSGHDEL